jgi:hypothetical protein
MNLKKNILFLNQTNLTAAAISAPAPVSQNNILFIQRQSHPIHKVENGASCFHIKQTQTSRIILFVIVSKLVCAIYNDM